MKTKILYIALVLIILSCSSKDDKAPININGGSARNNNYSHLGNFYDNIFSITPIEMKDKSGGFQLPLVIDNLRIVVTSVNGSVALLSEHKAVWEINLGQNQLVASGMAADKDLNIYLITTDGEVRSYSIEGNLRWKYKDDQFINRQLLYDDLLCQNDGLLVATSSGTLIKLSFAGNRLWSYNHGMQTMLSFCSDRNGNISFPATHNEFGKSDTLHRIKSDGKFSWKKGFENIRFLSNPITSGKVTIIPASYDINEQNLYLIIALDENGKEIWRREINLMPRSLSSDDEGLVYVQASNSGYGESITGIFCLDQKGNIKWKQYLDVKIPSPLILGKDVVTFLGNRRNATGMFFLNKQDGVLIKSVSLSDAPPFNHKPFVMNDPAICFLGLEKMFLIKIDDSAINKVLPW
jgi:outer membrane protein assembly factor BamB